MDLRHRLYESPLWRRGQSGVTTMSVSEPDCSWTFRPELWPSTSSESATPAFTSVSPSAPASYLSLSTLLSTVSTADHYLQFNRKGCIIHSTLQGSYLNNPKLIFIYIKGWDHWNDDSKFLCRLLNIQDVHCQHSSDSLLWLILLCLNNLKHERIHKPTPTPDCPHTVFHCSDKVTLHTSCINQMFSVLFGEVPVKPVWQFYRKGETAQLHCVLTCFLLFSAFLNLNTYTKKLSIIFIRIALWAECETPCYF